MSHIKKAPKNNRNQPANFEETIAAPIAMPAAVTDRPRLTLHQIRLGLSVVWVAAALIAGVGIGRMINDSRNAVLSTEPPAPVAMANVTATSANSGSIGGSEAVSLPDLKVVPAAAITQAQAGSVFATLPIINFHPADTSNSLQPGFSNNVRIQGNVGTIPVR
jgi:hypothetical protein